MQKQKNDTTQTYKSKVLLTLFLFILFLASVAYMVFLNKENYFLQSSDTTSNNKTDTISEGQGAKEKSDLEEGNKEHNLPINQIENNHQTIGPNTEEEVKKNTNYQGEESNVSSAIDSVKAMVKSNDFSQTQPSSDSKNLSLEKYRTYLQDVNLLMINFLQNKKYSEYLNKVNSVELPKEIKNILIDLENYDNKYLSISNVDIIKNHHIIPPWVEKFIKIEKKSPLSQEKENLQLKITTKLDSLVSFFYSPEFQQNFIE